MARSFPSFLLMCTTCFRFRCRQHLLGLDLPVAIQLYTLPLHIISESVCVCECVWLNKCIAVNVCPSFDRFVDFYLKISIQLAEFCRTYKWLASVALNWNFVWLCKVESLVWLRCMCDTGAVADCLCLVTIYLYLVSLHKLEKFHTAATESIFRICINFLLK